MEFWGLRGSLLGLVIVTVLGTGEENGRPLVKTQYGELRGVTVPVKETPRTVDAFFGVPFAKPPVGPLRFASPERPESWGAVRDASEYPPMCLQNTGFMAGISKYYKTAFQLPPVSEDCLYLNVFTPTERARNVALPVMVFIHGGGLVFGGASIYDGSALSAYEDVVLVSIQYRMGILGFLSTGDGQLQGNYGLLDQVAALQWIQENIADFGGDPKSVTIFGESAGGISVSALILSPLTKGLFHKAISESGVITLPGLVVSKAEDLIIYRNMVAKFSGCEPAVVADCLRKKSEEELLAISVEMGFRPLPICVDGVFLPKPAEEILAAKENHKVPFLLGMNEQEFGWVLLQIMNVPYLITAELDRAAVELALQRIPLVNLSPSATKLVMDEYLGDTNDPDELRERLFDICGDKLFAIPAFSVANYHRASGSPVYFYQYQHRPSLLNHIKPDYVKADHTDELIYVFGGPFLRNDVVFAGDATKEEKALSKTIMKYWANFARKGDPNGPGLVQWLQYDANKHYLELNLEQKCSKNLKGKKYKFWKKMFSELQKQSAERGDHTEL